MLDRQRISIAALARFAVMLRLTSTAGPARASLADAAQSTGVLKASVAMLDDDTAVLRSAARLLALHGFDVKPYSSPQLLLAEIESLSPVCLVAAFFLPDLTGLDVLRALEVRGLSYPTVFWTAYGNIRSSVQAMRAGAVDFLTKPFDQVELLDAVKRAVAHGRLSRERARSLSLVRARVASLTERERQVFEQIIEGQLNKQVAGNLCISEKTVKVHRARVMRKMCVKSLAQLVRAAGQIGMQGLSLEPAAAAGMEKAHWRAVDSLEYRFMPVDERPAPIRAEYGRPAAAHFAITPEQFAEHELEPHRYQIGQTGHAATFGQLSSALARELNQPLAGILANAQAGEALAKTAHRPADLEESFREIVKDVRRASQIVQRLCTLLRRRRTELELVDLNRVVDDSLTLTRSELLARNVRLVKSLAPDPVTVRGDAIELQHLALNLIVNACEAMSATEPRKRTLQIATVCDELGRVCLVIADSGPGIGAEHRDRLFEPFYTTKEQGLGLGLSICRSIAAIHDGDIKVTNRAAGGAEVKVELPRANVAAAASSTWSSLAYRINGELDTDDADHSEIPAALTHWPLVQLVRAASQIDSCNHSSNTRSTDNE